MNRRKRQRELDKLVRVAKAKVIFDDHEKVVIPNEKDASWRQIHEKGDERAEEFGGFKRYTSHGDGNCLFRSFSQSLVGHQNLHKPIRIGTAALMALHPERYKPVNMHMEKYIKYIKDDVSRVGKSVRSDVQQAAADLLHARVVDTYSTSSIPLREVIPHEGPIIYDINHIKKPKHADTLGREHIYPYHYQDNN